MNKLADRLEAWVNSLGAPQYELRCKTEVIDGFEVTEDSNISELIADVIAAAESDAEDEGKPRNYMLVGILEHREQHVCPIKIRIRPQRATNEAIVAALTKQNTELHATLMKERASETDRLVKLVDLLHGELNRTASDRNKMIDKQGEVFDKLEALRSKELDRQLQRERHEKDVEIKDRITDALLPLGVAMAKRFTNVPMLPKVDLDAHGIQQICAAMTETQLERIEGILGERWADFRVLWLSATEKPPRVDVDAFWALVDGMSAEQQSGLISVLNMGQQAALQELWISRKKQEGVTHAAS